MSKAIFFDWDDTLAIRLSRPHLVDQAKEQLGAPPHKDKLISIRRDDAGPNYTTDSIMSLLVDLTNSDHKWFIVSCGTNEDQLKDLQEKAGDGKIVPNGTSWNCIDAIEGEEWQAVARGHAPRYNGDLKAGVVEQGEVKLGEINNFIQRHFGGNIPAGSLFVDDDSENTDIVCGARPGYSNEITPIIPGKDEQTKTVRAAVRPPPGSPEGTWYPVGNVRIEGTFFTEEGGTWDAKKILRKDKVDTIRTMLNLPVGGHPAGPPAPPAAPLAGPPAPPAAPTGESDEAMARRLAQEEGTSGISAFHQQHGPLSGPPAPPAAAPPAGAAVPTWEWQEDDGQWTPYSAEVSAQLEAARSTGERSVNVPGNHWVDPKNMEQGSWEDGSKRDVRRTEGAGPLSGPAAAPLPAAAGAAHAGAAHAGAAGKSAQEKLIEKQIEHPKGLQQCTIAGKGRWKIRVKKDWPPAGVTSMTPHRGQGEVYFCIDDEIMKENLKESISGEDLDGVKWWFNRVTSDSYSTGTWTSRWSEYNKDDWITDYITTISGKSGDTWSAILDVISDHVPSVKRNIISGKLEKARAQLGTLQGLGEQGVGAAREQAIKVRRLEAELAALSGGGKKRRNKRRRKNTKRRTKKRKYTKRKSKRSKTKRQSKRQSKKRKKTKRKSTKKRKNSSR